MTVPSRFQPRTGRHRPLADINVTPLVDVMLVLLVVFMITAPMLAAGLKVDLPKASTAQPLPPNEPIVVTVGRDGGLAVGREPVARADLVATLRAGLGGRSDRPIHVRGDREAPYGEIVAVIDLLAADGLTRIALVAKTRPSAEAGAATAPASEATP